MSLSTPNGHTNGHINGEAPSNLQSLTRPHRTLEIPILSRQKPPQTDNEEADVHLSLGEFDRTPTLSHSECRLLITQISENRGRNTGGRKPDETETMTKTRDWLEKFARFKTKEATMQVDVLLAGYAGKLDTFERSQLASLCPADGDEAFTLIPSLKPKFTIAEMDELTRQVAELRTFE